MFGIGKAVTNAVGGFAKGFGAKNWSAMGSIAGPLAARTITGAGLGMAGTGLYNYASGENRSMSKGALYGALALGGLKAGKMMMSSNRAINFGGLSRWGSSAMNRGNKMWRGLHGMDRKSWLGGMYGKLGNRGQGIVRRGLQGAVPGAMYGSMLGAGYGAFSDRESIMSGAFKGALYGAAMGATYRNFRGGFGRFTPKHPSAYSVPRSGQSFTKSRTPFNLNSRPPI